MNKNAKLGLAVVAIVVAVGVFLVMADSDEVASPSQSTTETQQNDTLATEENDEAKTQAEADQVFDVGMQNFSFSEDEISVNAGDTITVNLTNNGGTHDFVIDELDVQSDLTASGQTTSVTFTVPEDATGQTYSFYCSVSNHRAQGMEGQLTVN